MRLPVEFRNIPNSHNQCILQVIPPINPITNASPTPQFYNPSGRSTGGHFNSSLESSSAAATRSSSSSSLISGTEDDLFTTESHLPTRDGPTYFQPSQVMHDSMRKYAQINAHAGAEIGPGLRKQYSVQTHPQSLLMTNSHLPQNNYLHNHPCVNRNEMMNFGSYPQTSNYEFPYTRLPAFEVLSNAVYTEQTASRRQTRSIGHKVVCPQKDFPLPVNTRCNNSGSSCNYVAENSYEIIRGSPMQQINQHSYSNHSTACVKKSQLNACASTGNDKTQTRNWSNETAKPQLKHTKAKTDKVQHWIQDRNNTFDICTGQDSLHATQRDELTARQARDLTESSYEPIGLFHGKPLSDTQQSKQCEIKKHSPHNTCVSETVKNGNLMYPCHKDIQKSQTLTRVENCMYKSPTQSQHCNNTDTCCGLRPILPTNVLSTDVTIERIRQKELPKYPFNGTSNNRCSQANIQKVDAPIDEAIKLLDEKSLQESVMRLPTRSNRESVSGREILEIREDRSAQNKNRYKEVISQTLKECKSSCRQAQRGPVCTTDSDRRNCLKETSHKENGAPVRRGKHQMQTSNIGVHNVKEDTSHNCMKQKSHHYYGSSVANCGTNNTFNCESAEVNFRYPYVNQQNTEHDRMHVYIKESNSVNDLSGVSYNAHNHQNINKNADNTTAEHFTDHQFVDVNQRLLPISETRNLQPSRTEIYKYGTAYFLTSGLPNKDIEHTEMSYHSAAKVLEERAQNTQSHKPKSQDVSQSFQNKQTAGLFDTAHTCARQSVPSSHSKANQHSNIVPPCSQAAFVIPKQSCYSSSSSSVSQSLQDTTFKIPYSVDRRTSGSGLHCNGTVQTASCYPSIGAGSDASMKSDNSESRSHIAKTSASEKTHCYQHDFECKDTLPAYNELLYQRPPQISYQQLQQRTHNPQLQLENQNQKESWQQEELQLYFYQRDKQIISQDINSFQSHGSKGGMNLPCFLQSAHFDDSVETSRSSHLQISQHRLNQTSLFQRAQSMQSETLDSIMTSISEKSQMSTGTSDDCYTDKTQSSEQQTQDTANPDTQQGNNNTANPLLTQMPPNTSKTVSSLQGASSGTSSSQTNPDRNLYSPTGSYFLEAKADDLFPPLNFEDCRDAMPLSPQSSPDINPVQTVTKLDQVLDKYDGPGQPCGISDKSTSRSCERNNAGPKLNTHVGVGSSNSAGDGDSQV